MNEACSARSIAVIGMAGRFPGANDVERYWQNLLAGVESITHAPVPQDQRDPEDNSTRFIRSVARVNDIDLFDAEYFRIPPAEAVLLDPQHRVLLEVAAVAMQDAGYHAVRGEQVGVFVGCGENYYLRDFVEPHESNGARASDASFPPSASGTDVRILSANEKDFLAARIAFKLGLNGPSITVQATCATGLTAVALACSALIAGDCDIALAGGVGLVMPDMEGYTYTSGGIFSADGHCRAFDAAASGTVPGSGAALVVLRREDDARAKRDRQHAVIRGWAINNDGGSRAGFSAPSAAGQQAVIQAALTRAEVTPDEIGYVETHGTATPIGDAVEIEALRRVFASATRDDTLVLGAVKPNIGHADAAAGIAGLIKAVLVVERGTIPPTLHFRSADPELGLAGSPFLVSTEPTPWQSRVRRLAGVSAFGLGGNNAHVVIEAPAPLPPAEPVRPRQVITLSARTEAELLRMRSSLADWVQDRPSLTAAELADAAFTLALGRPQFEYRWASCVADAATLLSDLHAPTLSARPVLRWSLYIHGSFSDHAAHGRRRVAEEPLFRAALVDLIGDSDLDRRPDTSAAALSALAAVRALTQIGLSFGRIEAPIWARPAVDWLSGGGERSTLEQAISACRASDDDGIAPDGTGCLLVGPAFDVAASVGQVWSQGGTIDWDKYFSAEPRGRVPLPTYPFNRRRYWLERASRRPVKAAEDATAADNGGSAERDLIEVVAYVWQSVLGLDAIDHDAHFVDELSGDSMYAVEIGARLGEIFHLDVPIDLPFTAPTVASAAKFIEDALANAGPERSPATA